MAKGHKKYPPLHEAKEEGIFILKFYPTIDRTLLKNVDSTFPPVLTLGPSSAALDAGCIEGIDGTDSVSDGYAELFSISFSEFCPCFSNHLFYLNHQTYYFLFANLMYPQ